MYDKNADGTQILFLNIYTEKINIMYVYSLERERNKKVIT